MLMNGSLDVLRKELSGLVKKSKVHKNRNSTLVQQDYSDESDLDSKLTEEDARTVSTPEREIRERGNKLAG